MPLFSPKEVLNLKLSSIPAPMLRELANQLGVSSKGTAAEIIKRILAEGHAEGQVNRFIKQMYLQRIDERRQLISDSKLYGDITNYVVCTWFNHWTTVLIEEHISAHRAVIPTIKNVKGVDLFFDGQPFDLKITYLPRDYDASSALKNPTELAIWMYENQGEQRFGDDNRLFVVLFDTKNPEDSWKLKRDFDLVFNRVDALPESESREKMKSLSRTKASHIPPLRRCC